MELKDAVEIYQTHYSKVDIIWGYFSTVSIALLGFTLGSDCITQKLREFRAVQIGYFIFAIGNFSALISGQSDLIEIDEYISAIQYGNNIVISFSPIGLLGLSIFYWVVVGAVLLGLQYVYKSRVQS